MMRGTGLRAVPRVSDLVILDMPIMHLSIELDTVK